MDVRSGGVRCKNMKFSICGVPVQHCSGSEAILSSHMRKMPQPKIHSSSESAFNCHARYLVDVLGYERRGSREFSPPDGGPIRVLTKKSRFGGGLRRGKSPDKKKGGRLMPEKFTGGLIASY